MANHDDTLDGRTLNDVPGKHQVEKSLGDQNTLDEQNQSTASSDSAVNIDSEMLEEGIQLEDLSKRYTEDGILGTGGMGQVMGAMDTRLNRKVAIKRITGKAARSNKAIKRFLTEAQSIAAINHPNIVEIYDYGRSTEGPFLIMECVQGGSLLDRCSDTAMDINEAVEIFIQLCDGLAKAHAANIIHRDLKPANILITEDGVPKLTDFGLAKDDSADAGMTMQGAVIGTLDFMPPEQRQAAELTDHRSDLWSLAATFYQVITGKSPKIIRLADVPKQYQDLLSKALEDDKDRRFQTAMEMREAFLQAKSGVLDTSRSLGEGECLQCGTLNPTSRKFCRNADCAATLVTTCLKCEESIHVWDQVCGECGAKQQPLIEKVLKKLQNQQKKAEKLLQEFDFDAADKAADSLKNQEDPRLQQLAAWHDDFTQRLESARNSEYEHVTELLEEAVAHEEEFDYEAARRILNKVPKRLKETDFDELGSVVSIRKRISSAIRETKRLRLCNDGFKEDAKKLFGDFEFDKSLTVIESIETNDHPHLKEYDEWIAVFTEEVNQTRANTIEDREIRLTNATAHIERKNYKAALKELDTIPSPFLNPEVESLKEIAKSGFSMFTSLMATIKNAIRENDLEQLVAHISKAQQVAGENRGLTELYERIQKCKPELEHAVGILAAAEQHVEAGQARHATSMVNELPMEFLSKRHLQRIHLIKRCAVAESNLVETLRTANEDNKIDRQETWELLDSVQDVLRVAPKHERALALQLQLLDRIKLDLQGYTNALTSRLSTNLVRNVEALMSYCPNLNGVGVELPIVAGVIHGRGIAESTGNVDLFISSNLIPASAAEEAIKFTGTDLHLDNFSNSSEFLVDTVEILSQWAGTRLSVNGLCDLTPFTAKTLANYSGKQLNLDGIEQLTTGTSKNLAQTKVQILSLKGMYFLSHEVLECLKEYSGELLRLDGLRRITPEQAQLFAQFNVNRIDLWGVESICEEAANYLMKFHGQVNLNSNAISGNS